VEKNTQPKNPVRKVAIVGPESTGKTVLARMLAEHFHTEWVPEYAREYLDRINRPYTRDDLEIIALEQINLEDHMAKKVDNLLVCDTTLLVIKIWSEFKYGDCPDWIEDEVKHRFYDLLFLTYIDVPWVKDPQREHPHKRQFLYNLYTRELQQLGFEFVVIKGSIQERIKRSTAEINALLKG
jgi:NadR type nicotinamide-nucleotide adenylyltransferase